LPTTIQKFTIIPGVFFLILLAGVGIIVIRQGLGAGAVAVAVAWAWALAVAASGDVPWAQIGRAHV
jgi:hypothetical protein